MKAKAMVLCVVVLLSTTSLVQAQEQQLSGSVDLTYLSNYAFRGFDMYPETNGEGAIQPSINLDLFGTGFGLDVLMSRANKSGYENKEWGAYSVYYKNTVLEGQPCVTDYKVAYTFYNFPDLSSAENMQEISTKLSWPGIIGGGLVPSYTAICSWQSEGNTNMTDGSSGWLHVLGLAYDTKIPGLTSDTPEQPLHLSAEMVYNGGAWGVLNTNEGATSSAFVDHDWSHAVFGASTEFALGNNVTLVPGVYYQLSMDESVCKHDMSWAQVTLSYKF